MMNYSNVHLKRPTYKKNQRNSQKKEKWTQTKFIRLVLTGIQNLQKLKQFGTDWEIGREIRRKYFKRPSINKLQLGILNGMKVAFQIHKEKIKDQTFGIPTSLFFIKIISR